ncbi:VPLPA-CTERM sorting domain-containing protein [Methylobacter sp. S3L5C]|uniref:VPLPA-CTERM sorting domain-containing protein n=1 Tax=Methylobacter sp. S3L5C TaxID=2839024 RepID=UPI001FABAC00|nr:VPLPA-CTERM sorting domain-containing protein [Methylobacter sp. S3L5C]UOA10339.1 autotransporter-associated beta strand repeat-containing protein [Methylobacter sp. S3L5C]
MQTNRKVTPVSAAPQPSKWKLRAAIGLALGVGLAAQGVNASIFTWNGGSGSSSNWTSNSNWSGTAATSNVATDLVFDVAPVNRLTPSSVPTTLTLNSILFGAANTNTSSYTIGTSSSTFTIGSGGVVNNDNLAQNLGAKFSLSNSTTFNAASGDLNFTGAINLNNATSGTSTKTLTLDGANNIALSGVISNQTGGNNKGALVKNGTGTTTLSGTNSYTGTTTISGGTLQVGAGGTTGTISSSSAITNNATLAFNRSDALTVSNAITGSGSLDKLGAGTLTLSGSNSYTGATNINGGTLALNSNERLADTGTVNVNSGGTFDLKSRTETIGTLNLNSDGAVKGNSSSSSDKLIVATDYTNAGFGTGNAFDKSAGVTNTVINSSASNAVTQQTLSINGGTAAAGNATMAFGAKHVGDTATQTYNIGNAPTTGSGPTLRGAVTYTGVLDDRLSGSGIVTGGSDWIATAGNSAGSQNVTFSTATAGALNETLTVVNNFSNTNTQTLAITGSVYDYAKVGFQNTGGAGTWDGTGLTLDFGSFTQAIGSQTATFSLANIGGLDALYTDRLNGNYTFNLGTAFTSYNVSNFTDLAGGSSKTNLDFLFNTSTVGNYVGSIFLASTGHNISGYNGALDGMTINFKGSVVSAVPVPAAAWLFLTGMVGLLGLGRRNKVI